MAVPCSLSTPRPTRPRPLVGARGSLGPISGRAKARKINDPKVGVAYYGYRYLNVLTGRWGNRDPIEESGGVNLYGFVGNDSLSRIDYLGNIELALNGQGYVLNLQTGSAYVGLQGSISSSEGSLIKRGGGRATLVWSYNVRLVSWTCDDTSKKGVDRTSWSASFAQHFEYKSGLGGSLISPSGGNPHKNAKLVPTGSYFYFNPLNLETRDNSWSPLYGMDGCSVGMISVDVEYSVYLGHIPLPSSGTGASQGNPFEIEFMHVSGYSSTRSLAVTGNPISQVARSFSMEWNCCNDSNARAMRRGYYDASGLAFFGFDDLPSAANRPDDESSFPGSAGCSYFDSN